MESARAEGADQELTPGARRILEVASELFYRRGIHAVGVDTIAAESGVTKRTLYDRFGSKDGLLLAYLQHRDRRWRSLVTSRLEAAGGDPVRRVLAPFEALPEWMDESDRGCSFVNAFAELPEPDHPGHQIIMDEKKWLRSLFEELLEEGGAERPEELSVLLLSLHEGALVSNAIAEASSAADVALSTAESLVTSALQAA